MREFLAQRLRAMVAALTDQIIAERQNENTGPAGGRRNPGQRRTPAAVPAPRAAPFAGATLKMLTFGSVTTDIYDVGCLTVDTDVYAHGCFYRRKVPERMDGYYLRGLLRPGGTPPGHLGVDGVVEVPPRLRQRLRRHRGCPSRPEVTLDGDGCSGTNVKISWGSFETSMPVDLCPAKLDPYQRKTYYHHACTATWAMTPPTGLPWGTASSRGNGHGIGFQYRIAAKECDTDFNPLDYDAKTCTWYINNG